MKYRVWDPHRKRIIENVIIGKTSLVPLYTPEQLLVHDMSWEDFRIMEGLELENGKIIYDRDIVLNRDKELGVIIYHKGVFYFKYVSPYNKDPMRPGYVIDARHELKVVGNVASLKIFTDLDVYMALPYSIEVTEYKDGSAFAKIVELEGCMTEADSIKAALEQIEDAKREWLKAALEDKIVIPLPSSI